MRSTQCALLAIVLACTAATASAQQPATADTAQFGDLVRSDFAAIAHGDTAAFRARLADNVRWVVGTTGKVATKPQLLAAIAHLSPLVTIQYEVGSVTALRNRCTARDDRPRLCHTECVRGPV